MTIFYRDELGTVEQQINPDGVTFCDGYAYFNAEDNTDERVKVENILQIIS